MNDLPEELLDAIRLAQKGDKDAFELIFNHCFDPIYRFVTTKADANDVEDLVEQVFIKAWIHLEKYRFEQGQFLSWLFRIAQNTVYDHHRRRKDWAELHANIPSVQEDQSPRPQAEAALLQSFLKESLSYLKAEHQQVLTLKFLVGLSNEELAEVMKLKVGHVRVLQFRALQALRKILEQKGYSKDTL